MQNSVDIEVSVPSTNLCDQNGFPTFKIEQKERLWLAVKYYCHLKIIDYC